jgi:hypothetical protein
MDCKKFQPGFIVPIKSERPRRSVFADNLQGLIRTGLDSYESSFYRFSEGPASL